MDKYLNQLFIKDVLFDESILSSNLYISFDNASALRKEYLDVLKLIKIYDGYEIIKSNIRALNEGYQQGLFILKLDCITLFLRLILSDSLIYDALIYTVNDINFINRVFFNTIEIIIPDEFNNYLNINKAVIIMYKDNSNYKILKANPKFYEYIKYEDWDFNNKYQNVLNPKLDGELDLNLLKIYRSDNKLINIKTTYKVIDNVYCLIEE